MWKWVAKLVQFLKFRIRIMGVLRFRLFGFPIAVLPGYWLLSALMGANLLMHSLPAGLLFCAIMFVSILVHELGHAFAARAFGLPSQITLHMMGGATVFAGSHALTRGRDVVISLAGPIAGFLVAVASLLFLGWKAPSALATIAEETPNPMWVAVLLWSVKINLFWTALNLSPVIPFDGGRVLAAALGPKRRQLAVTVSLVAGIALAIVLFKYGFLFPAVMLGSAAISSFLRLREPEPEAQNVDEAALSQVLSAAERALQSEQFQQASQLSHNVLAATRTPSLGRRALSTLLWARLGLGDVQGARGLLLAAPEDTVDPYLAAAVYEAFGDLDEARRLLTKARSLGDERVQVTALLVKVLLAQSKFAAAANLTREIVERIAPDEARRVVTEARHGGAGIEAARLSLELAKTQRTLTDAVDAIFGFALAGLISEAKSAFSMALEYDAEAARKLLSDERLRGVRTDLEALCVP